jgi:5'-nucleotidase
MADRPSEASGMRILITNDDGIHAPGLQVLERIARSLTDDVWIVAPETEQSGASHSLTIHRPLRLRSLGDRRFVVDGTPTDCVLLALNRVLEDRRPDLVLSGVNHGSNIGEDVTYSGTIAAAMEATLLGCRAVALSQHLDPSRPADWPTAEHWGPQVIRKVMAIDWPRNVLVNVNFPAVGPEEVAGIQVVRHGKRKIGDDLHERQDPRGRTYFWIGTLRGEDDVLPDTDVGVIMDNGIAVTPLDLDLTHYGVLDMLRDVLR